MAYETTQVIKIRAKPSQQKRIIRTYGDARYTHNWAVTICTKRYAEWCKTKEGKRPDISFEALDREWTVVRPEFTKETCRCCQSRELYYVSKAFFAFIADKKKPKGVKKKTTPKTT